MANISGRGTTLSLKDVSAIRKAVAAGVIPDEITVRNLTATYFRSAYDSIGNYDERQKIVACIKQMFRAYPTMDVVLSSTMKTDLYIPQRPLQETHWIQLRINRLDSPIFATRNQAKMELRAFYDMTSLAGDMNVRYLLRSKLNTPRLSLEYYTRLTTEFDRFTRMTFSYQLANYLGNGPRTFDVRTIITVTGPAGGYVDFIDDVYLKADDKQIKARGRTVLRSPNDFDRYEDPQYREMYRAIINATPP
jgi:hypothetical protein